VSKLLADAELYALQELYERVIKGSAVITNIGSTTESAYLLHPEFGELMGQLLRNAPKLLYEARLRRGQNT
jgi:hypothetical protein